MTSATPKPRAGEHEEKIVMAVNWQKMFDQEHEMHAQVAAERDSLRERERELVEMLKVASEALRSSRHIMSDSYNRELAAELADKCDAALAKHGR